MDLCNLPVDISEPRICSLWSFLTRIRKYCGGLTVTMMTTMVIATMTVMTMTSGILPVLLISPPLVVIIVVFVVTVEGSMMVIRMVVPLFFFFHKFVLMKEIINHEGGVMNHKALL